MEPRMDLINSVLAAMTALLAAEQLDKLQEVLCIKLHDYEVQPRSTEVMITDNSAEGMLNRFIATKRLEGTAETTIRLYYPYITGLIRALGKPLYISIHTTAKVVTAKTSNFPLMFLYKNTNFLIIMIIKSLPSTSCYIIHLLFDTFLGANDPRFLCQLGIRTKKSKSNQPQFPYPHQNVPL